MSDETTTYVKIESHDKRVWFGIQPTTIWRILYSLALLWIGFGKDIVNKPEFATKHDLDEIKHELKTIDGKVSYLSGRMGWAGSNRSEDGASD